MKQPGEIKVLIVEDDPFFQRVLQKRVAELLPLCSVCHKVRDGDTWRHLDEYLKTRGRMDFSHGLCPECKAQHRPAERPEERKSA